jgi:hypothetical protein
MDMKKVIFTLVLLVVSAGAANAQTVYVFPDGRVQWGPNVNARAVPIDRLPADLQDALLQQRASHPTNAERLAQFAASRPRPVQYVNGVPTRSGVIPSALRRPVYQPPSQREFSGPSIGLGIGFGIGPFNINFSSR